MFRIIPTAQKSLIRFSISSSLKNSTASAHHAAAVGGHHDHHAPAVFNQQEVYPRIGAREIVGFGRSGDPAYYDAIDSPLPAIRWKVDTPELKALREKAKGDWALLTVEEKKALYRADFRITFAELTAPTGEWKFIVGMVLAFMGGSIWLYYFTRNLIYNYPRPATNSIEHQTRMLERQIAMGVGKVHGVSSEWDYEKGDWKKNTGAK